MFPRCYHWFPGTLAPSVMRSRTVLPCPQPRQEPTVPAPQHIMVLLLHQNFLPNTTGGEGTWRPVNTCWVNCRPRKHIIGPFLLGASWSHLTLQIQPNSAAICSFRSSATNQIDSCYSLGPNQQHMKESRSLDAPSAAPIYSNGSFRPPGKAFESFGL